MIRAYDTVFFSIAFVLFFVLAFFSCVFFLAYFLGGVRVRFRLRRALNVYCSTGYDTSL